VDAIQLAYEAAKLGLGVAMGRRPLVDQDLATGALVELGMEPIVAESAYWLVSSDDFRNRPDLAGFRHWVMDEAGVLDG
jgi:DNA-binding transcriptional LysR family regulator